MRILHLSDGSLPDWRIEKAAISSKNRGHEVYFAGKKISENYKSIFDKNLVINWNSRSRNKFPFYWSNLKKQMRKIIAEVKPDIIHAHNVFSAKMAKEIDSFPMVYDNHEYWSVYLKRQLEADGSGNTFKKKTARKPNKVFEKYLRNFLKSRYVKVWSSLEKDLVSSTPTITVSSTIIKDLEKVGKKVYLVPNFPSKSEIDWIPRPVFHEHKSSVYAGVEPTGELKSVHRNLDGFIDLFENDVTSDIGKLYIIGWNSRSTPRTEFLGFLDRTEMYKQMQVHSIGIIPFRPHWSHIYINPNKAYEYAHAGLFVVSSSGFVPVFDTLGDHCLSFYDYTDLQTKLKFLLSDMEELYAKRIKTYEFARNNLLWENYENNIFEAYKQA
ncbi:MAG TPA: glycosyltransferase [Candidatus Nitrosocosmicus sp.]|nr:glycosyltransferase [Candidatus Nitrosocosmicus sp.]